MHPEGRGAARELERLRYTYRRRLAGLSDDELEDEARRVGEAVAQLKSRLRALDVELVAFASNAHEVGDASPDKRAADEERRHELYAARQRLYLDLTTDLFRKQAALSAEEVRRWGGE